MDPVASSVARIQANHKKYKDLFDDNSQKDMVTIETFYKLLMAEMSNQDPLEPMSNTEFISQMASFTALQVQQEALHYNNSNYAQSLVGKTVIVARSTGKGLDIKSGPVERVNFTGGQFAITVAGDEFPLKNVMEVLDGGFGLASTADSAFATSLIGKLVTVAASDGITAVLEEGIVSHIEIKDGEVSVIIDGLAYPLYGVIKVQDASAAVTDDN